RLSDETNPQGGGGRTCSGCGAPLTPGQRYCLSCGTRSLPLPAVIATWLERVRPPAKEDPPSPGSGAGEGEHDAADDEAEERTASDYMPTPQAAAVAVMALLAFGVIVGSLTQQLAQSAGLTAVVLGRNAAAPQVPEAVEGEVEEEAAPAPVAAPSAAPAPPVQEAPEEVGEEAPESAPPSEPPPELPPEPTLPPVS